MEGAVNPMLRGYKSHTPSPDNIMLGVPSVEDALQYGRASSMDHGGGGQGRPPKRQDSPLRPLPGTRTNIKSLTPLKTNTGVMPALGSNQNSSNIDNNRVVVPGGGILIGGKTHRASQARAASVSSTITKKKGTTTTSSEGDEAEKQRVSVTGRMSVQVTQFTKPVTKGRRDDLEEMNMADYNVDDDEEDDVVPSAVAAVDQTPTSQVLQRAPIAAIDVDKEEEEENNCTPETPGFGAGLSTFFVPEEHEGEEEPTRKRRRLESLASASVSGAGTQRTASVATSSQHQQQVTPRSGVSLTGRQHVTMNMEGAQVPQEGSKQLPMQGKSSQQRGGANNSRSNSNATAANASQQQPENYRVVNPQHFLQRSATPLMKSATTTGAMAVNQQQQQQQSRSVSLQRSLHQHSNQFLSQHSHSNSLCGSSSQVYAQQQQQQQQSYVVGAGGVILSPAPVPVSAMAVRAEHLGQSKSGSRARLGFLEGAWVRCYALATKLPKSTRGKGYARAFYSLQPGRYGALFDAVPKDDLLFSSPHQPQQQGNYTHITPAMSAASTTTPTATQASSSSKQAGSRPLATIVLDVNSRLAYLVPNLDTEEKRVGFSAGQEAPNLPDRVMHMDLLKRIHPVYKRVLEGIQGFHETQVLEGRSVSAGVQPSPTPPHAAGARPKTNVTAEVINSSYINEKAAVSVPTTTDFSCVHKFHPDPNGKFALFKLSNLRTQIIWLENEFDIRWQKHHLQQEFPQGGGVNTATHAAPGSLTTFTTQQGGQQVVTTTTTPGAKYYVYPQGDMVKFIKDDHGLMSQVLTVLNQNFEG